MSCAVISCNKFISRRQTQKGIFFHRFPKDKKLLLKWTRALGLPDDFTWSSDKVVCSNHFNKSDYGFSGTKRTNKLKPKAVPSLLVYKKSREVVKGMDEQMSEETKENNSKASINLDSNEESAPIESTNAGSAELQRPYGEKYLRVCRTCMKVYNKEETVPLIINGNSEKTQLYSKIRHIMQMELYPVDDACLCKKCEVFINEVYDFMLSCRKNEYILSKYDWSNKTKNILHIYYPNQSKKTNEVAEVKEEDDKDVTKPPSKINEEKFVEPKDWNAYWKELDERDRLSDMEDHWYYGDEEEKKCYDFPRKNTEVSFGYGSQLPNDDDLFSPNFDKYFNTVGGQAGPRLISRCRKYHIHDDGDPPYICEHCGEVKHSKVLLTKHLKDHQTLKFECKDCQLTMTDWHGYLKHINKFHGNCNETFYCTFCSLKFANEKSLSCHLSEQHSEKGQERLLEAFEKSKNWMATCEYCYKVLHQSALSRHLRAKHYNAKKFSCDKCSEGFDNFEMYVTHKKSHGEVKTEEEVDDPPLVLENYEIIVDDEGNAKLVILEENNQFYEKFKTGVIDLD